MLVLYLTGSLPAKPELFAAMEANPHIGALLTPRNHYPSKPLDGWPTALDNGCFTANWDHQEWLGWLQSAPHPAPLFAVVPDVVADHVATLARWARHRHEMPDGIPVAFVLQDGQTAATVPWPELDAVFVGGTTSWKLGSDARGLVAEAKQRGKWAHMGRVNSLKRCAIAQSWGCDSVDGTFLAFGPDKNLPRLLSWMRALANKRNELQIAPL